MDTKSLFRFKSIPQMVLVAALLLASSACQSTERSANPSAEITISHAEVQAYMASVKHFFNPH